MLEKATRLPAIMLFCAVATFLLCLWQNPSSVQPQTTLYFDAGHYLDSVKRICEAVYAVGSGTFTRPQAESLAYFLLLDGPVLPGLAAAIFLITGVKAAETSWFTLVLMQCVLHALSASLIAFLSCRLSGSRAAAAASGLTFAAYPATLASAGLFLTEPLAIFLYLSTVTCATIAVLATGSQILLLIASILLGGSVALLLLLKPALAPAVAVILLSLFLCLYLKKRNLECADQNHSGIALSARRNLFLVTRNLLPALLAAAVTAISATATLAPWMIFTHEASGSTIILPARKPVYNIATGMNLESDGWGSYPTQAFCELFTEEDGSAPAVARALFDAHPRPMENLFLRKIARLWNVPWNDFHYRLAGLNFKAQTLLQTVLVILGFVASAFYVSRLVKKQPPEELFLSLSLVGTIFAHLVFVPFETIARYGYMSMPAVIILTCCCLATVGKAGAPTWKILSGVVVLAGAAVILRLDLLPYLAGVHDSFEQRVGLNFAIKMSAVALSLLVWRWILSAGEASRSLYSSILSLLLGAYFVVASGIALAFGKQTQDTFDWCCSVKPNEKIVQELQIAAMKPAWALVVIDGDDGLRQARVSVNGHNSANLTTLYKFHPQKWQVENYTAVFASLMRRSPEQVRKWRAVEVPTDWINWNGLNKIELTPGQGTQCKVFGTYKAPRLSSELPGFDEVSPGKLFNSDDEDVDPRFRFPLNHILAPAKGVFIDASGNSPADLSPKAGTQTGAYRIHLLAGYPHPDKTDDRSTAQAQEPLKRCINDEVAGGYPLRAHPTGIPNRIRVNVPRSLLTLSHLEINLEGNFTSDEKTMFTLALILESGPQDPARTVMTEPGVQYEADPQGKRATLEGTIPTGALDGEAPAITIEMTPLKNSVAVDKWYLTLTPSRKATFKNHAVRFL